MKIISKAAWKNVLLINYLVLAFVECDYLGIKSRREKCQNSGFCQAILDETVCSILHSIKKKVLLSWLFLICFAYKHKKYCSTKKNVRQNHMNVRFQNLLLKLLQVEYVLNTWGTVPYNQTADVIFLKRFFKVRGSNFSS